MGLHYVYRFRALNRYTCRKVLEQLRRGPMTVAEVADKTKPVSRVAVSQALALLLDAGLVSRRRKGRNHFYQLRAGGFTTLIGFLEALRRS